MAFTDRWLTFHMDVVADVWRKVQGLSGFKVSLVHVKVELCENLANHCAHNVQSITDLDLGGRPVCSDCFYKYICGRGSHWVGHGQGDGERRGRGRIRQKERRGV